MKRYLLILLTLLSTAAIAQTFPDSTRQTGGTNVTLQFNSKGANASTSTLQYYNPLNQKYSGIYSALQSDARYAQISGTSVVVSGIPQLLNYNGTGTAVTVKDTLQGGLFGYTTATMPIDSGITFPATGKGSGTWVRLDNTSVADAAWYGVSPGSTMNGLRLNNATHSPYVSTLEINFRNDTLLIETPIYIENRANFVLNPNTTLKHPNEVPYALSATAAPGDTIIYIANADKKFLVNQTIGLYSTAAPIVGLEAGENWPAMSASRIKAVTPTYVLLYNPISYGYNTDSASVAYNVSNVVIVENANFITINNPNLYGNKANTFFGYPRSAQTESDIANNGISVIGSSNVAINNLNIYNFNLNGVKLTRNNYGVTIIGGVIKNSNGKNIIANYGGSGFYINNILVDSSRYNDGINFNGDISGYTLNNVFVNNVRSSKNGRWGIRAQGVNTRLVVNGFTSTNDGGAIQSEGAESKIYQLTVKTPKDFRFGSNTVEAGIRLAGSGTILNGFSIDSVGVPANMIQLEQSNIKVDNGFIKNMPSSVSSGKTVWRGYPAISNVQMTNISYDNIDQTKIMRNTSGGAYFGDLTSSGSTVSMLDRPNFGGSTTARNRFGNYTSANSSLTVTDNTSSIDINLGNSNTYTAAQTFSNGAFPVVIERSSGAFGLRYTRSGVEQGALFFDGSNVFTARNATGNFLTVTSGSTRAVFPGGGSAPSYLLTGSSSGTITIQPQAAAGTYNFNLPTTAGTSGQLLTSGGGSSTAMTWTSNSISLATPGTTGTAPNWSAATVGLGGTATLNIPNAATANVTGGLLSKTQYDALAAANGTVTSITPGYGFTSSTPITTSGTLTIDTTNAVRSVLNSWSKSAADARYLKLTGGTLTGSLTAPSTVGLPAISFNAASGSVKLGGTASDYNITLSSSDNLFHLNGGPVYASNNWSIATSNDLAAKANLTGNNSFTGDNSINGLFSTRKNLDSYSLPVNTGPASGVTYFGNNKSGSQGEINIINQINTGGSAIGGIEFGQITSGGTYETLALINGSTKNFESIGRIKPGTVDATTAIDNDFAQYDQTNGYFVKRTKAEVISDLGIAGSITSNSVSAQTTGQTLITYAVGGADKVCNVSGFATISSATALTFNLNVSYTDENNNPVSYNLLAAIIADGQYGGSVHTIKAKAGTNIVISTNLTGTATYNAGAYVQPLF